MCFYGVVFCLVLRGWGFGMENRVMGLKYGWVDA